MRKTALYLVDKRGQLICAYGFGKWQTTEVLSNSPVTNDGSSFNCVGSRNGAVENSGLLSSLSPGPTIFLRLTERFFINIIIIRSRISWIFFI